MMKFAQTVGALILLATAPWAVAGDIASEDLPAGTRWYLHIDFERMRTSNGVGRGIYDYVAMEAFEKIDAKLRLDFSEDLDGVTVFGSSHEKRDDAAVVLHGPLDPANEDRIVQLIKTAGEHSHDTREGHDVYSFVRLKIEGEDLDLEMSDDDTPSFVVFGESGQTLITENPEVVDAFVESGGRIRRNKTDHPDVMLVLHAERSLMKGGFSAGSNGPQWDSSVLKNVEQLAVVIADEGWAASLSAQLVTDSVEMAGSLSKIVQGLVTLKSLDNGNDEEVQHLLNNTKIKHDDTSVLLSTHLKTETLLKLIDK